MPTSPFGDSKRSNINNAQAALFDLKKLAVILKKAYTWDIAVVKEYHHVEGTVDVWMKLDKKAIEVKGIPIWGRGGSRFRFGWPLTGAVYDQETTTRIINEPDVGMVFHPRLDSTRALEDFQRRNHPHTDTTHGPFSPIFVPGLPVASQSPTTGVVQEAATHQIGPDDRLFLVDPVTGAGAIIKSDGRLILRGLEVVSLGLDQVYEDAQFVARQGDAGDGLGGAIAGGSSVVKSG